MEIADFVQRATKLHTHTVVFKANSDEDYAARLALRGASIKAIARQTGLSESQVSFRLKKSGVKIRDARALGTPFAKKMLRATENLAATYVARNIAPKWLPFATSRVNQ